MTRGAPVVSDPRMSYLMVMRVKGNPDDLRRVATLFLEHGVESLVCVDDGGNVVGHISREAVAARLGSARP